MAVAVEIEMVLEMRAAEMGTDTGSDPISVVCRAISVMCRVISGAIIEKMRIER